MSAEIGDGIWGGALPRDVLETLMEKKIISCIGKRLDALWYGRCKRWRLRRKAIRRLYATRRKYQKSPKIREQEDMQNGRIY